MFVCLRACVRVCARVCACVRACARVCICLCACVRSYVCMYVRYATPPRHFVSTLSELLLRPQEGVVAILLFSKFTNTIILSTNNRITLSSYCVQLFATLCEHLRTIVRNAMRVFYDCSKLGKPSLHATITDSKFESWIP